MSYFTEEEFKELQIEINEGWINVNKHPIFNLYIYNYTKSTQYNWHWNKYTTQCRGLILDGDGNLVAKGFDKFFTDDQLISAGLGYTIPTNEPFEITNKVDGSLGVLYFGDDNLPYIATRGSFISEMAIEANTWLRNKYSNIKFNPKYTYMFEVIYPENKIVVDYGDERKLVLLAILNNETLKEHNIYDLEFDYIEVGGIERVLKFDGITDWKEVLSKFDGNNKEGFVVHFLNSDFRVKMKFEWYKNLSYILTYFTKKTIWKMVRDGKDIDTILGDIDDEYYPIVNNYLVELRNEYSKRENYYIDKKNEFINLMNSQYPNGYSQKSLALDLKEYTKNYGVEFDFGTIMDLIQGKDIFKRIWQQIEPKSVGSDSESE